VILFRHVDARFPFLWESAEQPPGRWCGEGEGPVQALADTPDGAWAELIRHEEIREADDLTTVVRALWAVDVPDPPRSSPRLRRATVTGGPHTYPACRAEARRLRRAGATGLVAPSAALVSGGGRGWRTDGGLRPGLDRDGRVVVLFGRRPDLVGWRAALGRPAEELLQRVRHFR
jgi:hypothetical protein